MQYSIFIQPIKTRIPRQVPYCPARGSRFISQWAPKIRQWKCVILYWVWLDQSHCTILALRRAFLFSLKWFEVILKILFEKFWKGMVVERNGGMKKKTCQNSDFVLKTRHLFVLLQLICKPRSYERVFLVCEDCIMEKEENICDQMNSTLFYCSCFKDCFKH